MAGRSRQPLVTGCRSADGFASSSGDGPLATHTDDSSVAAPCAPPAYDPPQSVTHPTLSGSSRTAKNLGRDAGYTGNALALLTGRPRAYGYRHTERFLAELAQVGADDTLTEVLARWTSDLWKARLRVIGSPVPVFYIDGHRKAVYADHLIPRGLVGRQGKVLGCRALVVLHDQEGHPLFVTTHRGDQHLTMGLPAIITRYELAADEASPGASGSGPRRHGR